MITFLLTLLETDEDKDLLLLLYDEYAGILNLIARDNLYNSSNIDDCIQETFVELIKSFDNFKLVPKEKRKAYISTICRRTAYRINSKDTGVVLFEDADDIELLNQSEPDFANFETIDIALALNKIDLKYREPIIMKYFNDYSTEEISIRLGISQNLVLQRIFRGKKLLHKLLTEG